MEEVLSAVSWVSRGFPRYFLGYTIRFFVRRALTTIGVGLTIPSVPPLSSKTIKNAVLIRESSFVSVSIHSSQ